MYIHVYNPLLVVVQVFLNSTQGTDEVWDCYSFHILYPGRHYVNSTSGAVAEFSNSSRTGNGIAVSKPCATFH